MIKHILSQFVFIRGFPRMLEWGINGTRRNESVKVLAVI